MNAKVTAGSKLHLLCDLPVDERIRRFHSGDMAQLKNLSLVHHVGSPSTRRILEGLPLAAFDHILVLAEESREDSPADSDAHNLATMLLVRDVRKMQARQLQFMREHNGALSTNLAALLEDEPHRKPFASVKERSKSAASPDSKAGVAMALLKQKRQSSMKIAPAPPTPKVTGSFVWDSFEVNYDDDEDSGGGSHDSGRGSGVGSSHDSRRGSSSIAHDSGIGSSVAHGSVAPSLRRASQSGAKSVATSTSAEASNAEEDMDLGQVAVEILDHRTKSTLMADQVIRTSADYILSHNLMSKVLAVILMDRGVKSIVDELLSEDGQGFFLYPCSRYAFVGEQASFWEISIRLEIA